MEREVEVPSQRSDVNIRAIAGTVQDTGRKRNLEDRDEEGQKQFGKGSGMSLWPVAS